MFLIVPSLHGDASMARIGMLYSKEKLLQNCQLLTVIHYGSICIGFMLHSKYQWGNRSVSTPGVNEALLREYISINTWKTWVNLDECANSLKAVEYSISSSFIHCTWENDNTVTGWTRLIMINIEIHIQYHFSVNCVSGNLHITSNVAAKQYLYSLTCLGLLHTKYVRSPSES